MVSERLLARVLMELRGTRRQKDLAARLDVSGSYVSQIESGEAIPSDERLAEIARALDAEDRLPEMLLRAAHDRVAGDTPNGKELREVYGRIISDIARKINDITRLASPRTFEHFPEAFEPLAIVTGDKREDPPKTIADLGAVSASPIDDRYLRDIPFRSKPDKISDKVFVLADDEYLKARFGTKNLLVIGSPAGNHLARKINRGALYRFAFGLGLYRSGSSRESADEIDAIIKEGARVKAEEGLVALKVFRDKKVGDLKFVINEFKQGGIFDPLARPRMLRARSLRDDVDFATVTLARHPYAESHDYVAIMVGGFHLPGTVHAVRQLSRPTEFTSHPLGGVLEVRMSSDEKSRWYERIEKADVQWDTPPYTLDDMRKGLEEIAGHPNWPGTAKEAAEVIKLVEAVTRVPSPNEKDQPSSAQGPGGGAKA